MFLLQAQNLEQQFNGKTLFKNANLDVQDNSKIALVGRNGVGKSTLVKMIIGEQEPSGGQVIKKRGLTIGYLAQNTGLDSNKSIYVEMENVFRPLILMEKQLHHFEKQISNMTDHNSSEYKQFLKQYDQLMHDFNEKNGYGFKNKIKAVLHGLGFKDEAFKQPISSLSGGQKTRLALAKLLLEEHDLLILDEPTNHLDIKTLSWLENYLQSYNGALLVISHDRYFLDKIVNEVYEINHHHLIHYHGNYSTYTTEKDARLKQQWKAYEKQQAEITHLQDFVNKNIIRSSTTKRAQSKRKQLEKIERLERPEGEKEIHFKFTPAKESGDIVLQVENGAVGYDDHILSAPINIDLRKHQILAIIGPNGIGKTTLLKSIIGQIPFLKGKCHLGTNVQIGYYDQEQHILHDNKTVLNEIWDEHPTVPEKDIRSALGSFLFQGDDVKKEVHSLSGGEKAALMLTKLSMNHDNFLVLDEPTNHLDIPSKEVLENALLNFKGTVLFVSHDRYFINKIATHILEINSHGSQLYLGNYDYYLTKKEEQNTLPKVQAITKTQFSSCAKMNYQQSKEHDRQLRKLKRQIQKLEEQINQLEEQKTTLEKQMTEPEIFNDIQKIQQLQVQLNKLTSMLSQTEEEWENKSIELEEFEK